MVVPSSRNRSQRRLQARLAVLVSKLHARVQEDTIIFSVLERAQFGRNAPVYQPDAVPVPEFDAATGRRYSLLEYILRQTEQASACFRCASAAHLSGQLALRLQLAPRPQPHEDPNAPCLTQSSCHFPSAGQVECCFEPSYLWPGRSTDAFGGTRALTSMPSTPRRCRRWCCRR